MRKMDLNGLIPKMMLLTVITVLLNAGLSTNLNSAELLIYTTHEPPLNFTKRKNTSYAKGNDVVGITADIVREIMRRTGTKAVIELIPWSRGYRKALEKKDVVIFSMARTEGREDLFQWIGPIAMKKGILFAKKGSGIRINTLDDAKRVRKIGTMPSDTKELFLEERGFTNLEGNTIWEQSLRKLMMGRIDLWTQTDLDSPVIAKRAGVDINEIVAAYTFLKMVLYIGVSKKTSAVLVNRWQNALDQMKHDGTFDTIIKKWAEYYRVKNWIVRNGMLQVNYD